MGDLENIISTKKSEYQ